METHTVTSKIWPEDLLGRPALTRGEVVVGLSGSGNWQCLDGHACCPTTGEVAVGLNANYIWQDLDGNVCSHVEADG